MRADLRPFHQDDAPVVPRSHSLQQVRSGQPDHHARVLLLGKLGWDRPSLGAPVPRGHQVNPVQPQVVERCRAVGETADAVPDRCLTTFGRRRPHGAREVPRHPRLDARMPSRCPARKVCPARPDPLRRGLKKHAALATLRRLGPRRGEGCEMRDTTWSGGDRAPTGSRSSRRATVDRPVRDDARTVHGRQRSRRRAPIRRRRCPRRRFADGRSR